MNDTATRGKTGRAASGTALFLSGAVIVLAFIAWILVFGWLATQTGETDPANINLNNLGLSLATAAFWAIVALLVIAGLRWSNIAFASWTTSDLMLAAVLGAVFGLLFVAWALVYNFFAGWLADWAGLFNGFWYLPTILVPYIIRKPGAALVGETIAGVIAVMLGSPWGILGSAIAAATQGLGAELVFGLTGWRRYGWLTLMLAGIGATVAGFVYVYPIWNYALSPVALTINFVANLAGVLLFAVVGGKLLGDALLATGVLNRFAIGRERRAAQSDF